MAIRSIEFSPSNPGAEALVQLAVNLHNAADRAIYALQFDVRVAGVELPVYRDQVFVQQLPPGEVTRVKLFNFWTQETGRPLPEKGPLEITVSLRAAEFLELSQENTGSDAAEETVEVWTPAGAVPGLPIALDSDLAVVREQ